MVEQLRHYREFLQPRHMALAILTSPTTAIPKTELRQLGVEVFQEITNTKIQDEFKNYIISALKE
ncbi:hypothetical protein [Vulcanisaeta distributa]|uniref:Uncharacterized protein n=1 Tax=Vulcanisaeta distributa (strain DSM 14429 / JCM 11212 / NBRC 100878 / IC-017) TaxID=572478 RepID=E1QSD8_VULDI|nr:hypothetical protein [Vulcanisaeta distributa]ADN49531.1 hypothetical protein Vdis_0118 [Vulcanisaeta distributa DSM 14429]